MSSFTRRGVQALALIVILTAALMIGAGVTRSTTAAAAPARPAAAPAPVATVATPVAKADTYRTPAGAALRVGAGGVLRNDTGRAGKLTAAQTTATTHGTLALGADGSFRYTPRKGFVGPDWFSYRAKDGELASRPATVTLVVLQSRSAPTAVNDSYSTGEDVPLVVGGLGVLANDTDPESDPLTVTRDAGPQHGTLNLNSDGTFTYTPDPNWFGVDSWTYSDSDGTGNSNVATVTITVTADNDAPDAVGDTYEVAVDSTLTVDAPGVLGNDSDVDGDTLTARLESNPAHGTLDLRTNGSFTYTPTPGFTGPDVFQYHTADGDVTSASTTVTLTVVPNEPPIAGADAYTIAEDLTLTVNAARGLLANDSDADGDTLTATLLTMTKHGTLTLNADGSFSYRASANFNGSDSFSYKVFDGKVYSETQTVTLTVTPVADALTVKAARLVVSRESHGRASLEVRSLVTSNVDQAAYELIRFTNGMHGSVSCTGTLCTYTPKANYVGADRFEYTLRTVAGAITRGTVTVDVLPGGATAVEDYNATADDNNNGSGTGAGGLANTGSAPGGTLRLGLALLLAGMTLLVLASTRRRRPETE
jgi:large repetitive protein